MQILENSGMRGERPGGYLAGKQGCTGAVTPIITRGRHG
jgi:hypothetical protein